MQNIKLQAAPPRAATWGPSTTPLGKVIVAMAGGRVCRIAYLRGKKPADIAHLWQLEWPTTKFTPGPIPKDFPSLPLLMIGNAYQRKAWVAIMNIPLGLVASYGDIAARIGEPRTPRAVGRACNQSYLDYIVPCHRVVAAAGLGGYGQDGLTFKEQLLKAEGVEPPYKNYRQPF